MKTHTMLGLARTLQGISLSRRALPHLQRLLDHYAAVDGAVASLMACGIARQVAAQLVHETIDHEAQYAMRTIYPPDFGRRLSELQWKVAGGATRRRARD